MNVIHISSAERPFDSSALARQAAGVISLAAAMGLLVDAEIRRLDLPAFRRVVGRIAEAGIGREAQAALAAGEGLGAAELHEVLRRLAEALEESPSPSHEWRSLEEIFGLERLAELVAVSAVSARRYRSGGRATPDPVAARLHFLATLVGELAGAYNEFGIRRWFERPRTPLEGRAPADLLAGEWRPEDDGPRRVRELARSLGASAAV